jgi:hypothetical protein
MWLPGLERERELPGAVCERERERGGWWVEAWRVPRRG